MSRGWLVRAKKRSAGLILVLPEQEVKPSTTLSASSASSALYTLTASKASLGSPYVRGAHFLLLKNIV